MDKWHPTVVCDKCGQRVTVQAIKSHLEKHELLDSYTPPVDPLGKVYTGKKVYGPYTRKDGRQIVILKTPGPHQDHMTVSYPKYLVEVAIGRYLESDEQIDHIDGDFLNNDLSNLRIVKQSEHARSHVPERTSTSYICPICGSTYIVTVNSGYRKTCSRHCAGILSMQSKNSVLVSQKLPEYRSRRNILEDIPTVQDILESAGVVE